MVAKVRVLCHDKAHCYDLDNKLGQINERYHDIYRPSPTFMFLISRVGNSQPVLMVVGRQHDSVYEDDEKNKDLEPFPSGQPNEEFTTRPFCLENVAASHI